MIRASELRIGNWIRNNVTGNNIKVGYHEIRYLSIWPDESKRSGIPLTPEILEKCGFKKQNNGWNKNKKSEYDENYFGLFDHNYCSGKLDLKYNVGNGPIPSIKFLHQLQNLYFAISGEELEVKL